MKCLKRMSFSTTHSLQEQDKFDAAMAKVPKDKFVKGIGNLIKKRGL